MAATAIPIDTLPSINPATGEVLAHFERTPASLLPEIVSRARVAQGAWAKLPIRDRCAKLRGLRERIMASRNELADAVVRESGKPRVEALFADIFVALDSVEYWSRNAAGALRTQRVPHHSIAAKAKRGYLAFEPLGVIAIISSWNYPLAIPLSQIIPAVAAGNAVVCKTSDFTPQCGALIEKLFIDAGFPGNLVTVVQGGGEVGQALIDASPDKVLFTGSVATGRRVAEACAKKLIPSVLELGGKDAMIVLADADLEVASSAAVWGSYTNCGQVCLSVERLFVEQSVAERFMALCVEKTKKLRLGPGSNPATDVGPLIRPQHVQRMSDLVHDAVSRGAKVLCGGNSRPDLGPNFFEPTVIAGVDSSMKLFQEETFGADPRHSSGEGCQGSDKPRQRFTVCACGEHLDKEQGSRNGAGGGNARRSSHGERRHQLFRHCGAPHGGCGASGWGRTHGEAGLLEMAQMKYIDVDRLPRREKPGGTVMARIWSTPRTLFSNLNFPAALARSCGTPAVP